MITPIFFFFLGLTGFGFGPFGGTGDTGYLVGGIGGTGCPVGGTGCPGCVC